jgi:hypothetical protein
MVSFLVVVDKKDDIYGTNCYHVEHIIDRRGPEFADDPKIKDIAGNLVMTWGRWNSALGNLAWRNYTASSKEKAMVYGQEIMNLVRETIKKCQINKQNEIIHTSNNISLSEITEQTINEIDICTDIYSCDCDDTDVDCGCDCSAYESNMSSTHCPKQIYYVLMIIILVITNFLTLVFLSMCYLCYKMKKTNLSAYRRLDTI